MKSNLLKKCIFIAAFAIIILIVVIIMLRYDTVGEQDMPYEINKILLVSTVDGKALDDPNNIWNIDVSEVNDVYVFINKTKDTDLTIKEIKFENFIINSKPQKGEVKLLRPTGELSNLYTQSSGDYLNEGITYLGGIIDDMKSLEIANTGGTVGFRLAINNLGTYVSNDNQEINYDGRLLSNIDVKYEEIKFDVSFDIIIKTSKDISYKGTVNLSLPLENVMNEKDANEEITDFSDVIFKRI